MAACVFLFWPLYKTGQLAIFTPCHLIALPSAKSSSSRNICWFIDLNERNLLVSEWERDSAPLFFSFFHDLSSLLSPSSSSSDSQLLLLVLTLARAGKFAARVMQQPHRLGTSWSCRNHRTNRVKVRLLWQSNGSGLKAQAPASTCVNNTHKHTHTKKPNLTTACLCVCAVALRRAQQKTNPLHDPAQSLQQQLLSRNIKMNNSYLV